MLQKEQARAKGAKHHNKFVYIYEDDFVSDSKELTGHGSIIRKYDSWKEYARHKELLLLERAGRIKNLCWQVPILINEGFVGADGKKVRPIYYTADFTYEEEGESIVEDVKGIDRKTDRLQTTEAFRLKWKLLKSRYPQKVFRIH